MWLFVQTNMLHMQNSITTLTSVNYISESISLLPFKSLGIKFLMIGFSTLITTNVRKEV